MGVVGAGGSAGDDGETAGVCSAGRGDSANPGGVGGPGGGEAGSGAGGSRGDEAIDTIEAVDDARQQGGKDDGVEAAQGRGERRSSPSISASRSSSTSLRRLLFLLGGGVDISGDDGAETLQPAGAATAVAASSV